MVTPDQRVKILDFGLAKLFADPGRGQSAIQTAALETAEGTILGTPGYMSPEQIRGEGVDFRSDQFSFGIIMYELLTGRRPFEAGTTMDEIAAILNREPPSLHSLSPDIPLPLAWIVIRCLQKKPSERYGATRDLYKDLRNLSNADSGQIERPATRAPRRSWVWPTAAVLALLVIAATWAMTGNRIEEPVRVPLHVSIELPRNVSMGSPEILTTLDLSPDGRHLAISAAGQLWVRSLASPDWRPLAGTEGGISPEWSPDGRSIAFYADGKLKRVSIDGGPSVELVAATYNGKPAWAPDGAILFSHLGPEGSGIFAIDEDGGEPRQVTDQTSRGELVHIFPEILPDGKRFLYLALRADDELGFEHSIRVASIDGSDETVLGTIPSMIVVSGEDQIIYAHEGMLLRQSIDLSSPALVGQPEVIAGRCRLLLSTGIGLFTSSTSGVVVYQKSPASSRLVWRDRTGAEAGELGGPARHESFAISPEGNRVAVAIDDPKLGSGDIWLFDLTRNTSTRLTHSPVDELYPGWSADGGTIYFRSDALGPPNIYSLDLSQRAAPKILRRTFTVDQPYEGHPTGNWSSPEV
jgi:eukaryotic-like serine/threonine-protein kinase